MANKVSRAGEFLNLAGFSAVGRPIDLTGDAVVTFIDLTGANVADVTLQDMAALVEVRAMALPGLGSFYVDNCAALEGIYAGSWGNIYTNFNALPSLTYVEISQSAFSTLTFTACPVLAGFELFDCANLDTINCDFAAAGYVNLSGCAFTEGGVDTILADLDTNGHTNGEVDLSGGTNAIPSAAGLASKANLEGKGWTVTVNS